MRKMTLLGGGRGDAAGPRQAERRAGARRAGRPPAAARRKREDGVGSWRATEEAPAQKSRHGAPSAFTAAKGRSRPREGAAQCRRQDGIRIWL